MALLFPKIWAGPHMISKEEIEKIAKLARLNFSVAEADNFSRSLASTMEMIDELKEIDLSSVEPLISVCPIEARFRKDEVTKNDISGDLFENAPGNTRDLAKDIKCFIVPKVVE